MAAISPNEWASALHFDALEAQHGLPPGLLGAIVTAESKGNPRAENVSSGAQGLFQFMPDTAKGYKIDPYDPLQAAPAAAQELSSLYAKYQGDMPKTLAAWNWGQGRVDKLGMAKAPTETQGFISTVTGLLSPQSAEAASPGASPGSSAGGFDLADFDRFMGKQHAPTSPPTRPPQGAPPSDVDINTQVIPASDPTQPALLAPPGAALGQGTGGYQMTIDIAKPSEGNPPGPPAGPRRQPEDLDEGLRKALEPSAFDWRKAAAMGINAAGAGVGAIGGAGLGAMTSPVTGPVGPAVGAVAGEAAGSFAGHKINQALGLEPGDPKTFDPTLWPPSGDVLALGVPPVVRGAGALSTQIAKRLPGAPAALHEEAMQTLEGLPGRFAPARPSADLYADLAAGTNPAIPAINLGTQASSLLQRELALQPSLRTKPIVALAQDFQDLYRLHRGQIPLDQLYAHQQRLGLLVREADRMAWPQASGLKRLYGAIYDDIDAAIAKGIPEAATLRQATQAARREFAQEDLQQLIAPGAPGVTTRPDGLVQVHGGKLLDRFNRKLMTDKTFAGTFSPAERKEIQDLFHEMTQLPRIPPPRGQTFGSGGVLQRGGLVYLVTKAATGDPALATGMATAAAAIPPIIARAVMTPTGRTLLRQYLHAGQVIGPAELAALRTAATGEQREAPQGSGPEPSGGSPR